MATITGAQIVDRVRSLCASEPFLWEESVALDADFGFDPSQVITGAPVFVIEPLQSRLSIGQTGFREDRIDDMTVSVAYAVTGDDHAAVRSSMLNAVHSLTSAVVRDAHVTSGDYGILDEGKDSSISQARGASFLVLRLTLPVQYEIGL